MRLSTISDGYIAPVSALRCFKCGGAILSIPDFYKDMGLKIECHSCQLKPTTTGRRSLKTQEE